MSYVKGACGMGAFAACGLRVWSGLVVAAAVAWLSAASAGAAVTGSVGSGAGAALLDREDVGDRSAHARVFETPAGAKAVRISPGSVASRSGGSWELVDPALVRVAGGLRGRGGRFEARVPERLSDGPVVITSGADEVRVAVEGAGGAAASVDGAVARFGAVLPGADALVAVSADAVKVGAVLAGPDSAPGLSLRVEASGGLDLREAGGGALGIYDEGGAVVFALPAPYAVESGSARPSGAASYAVQRLADGVWRIRVSVDGRWLAAAGRRFPV